MPLQTIVLVVTALLVASAFTWFVVRKSRAEALQRSLAGVHDRAVKRVKLLDIQPLSVADRDRFANRWRMTQATFAENPAIAVSEAETLVNEVMRARGYPLSEYNLGTADISVEHPRFVTNYREAREIALAYQRGAAKTEDLRKAAIRYGELFDDLLDPAGRKNRT